MAASTAQRLRRVRWGVAECPLIKPYALSFTQLTSYPAVWVLAEDENGRVGLGEAVPLPGYNWETLETIRATVENLLAGAQSMSTAQLRERCRAAWRKHPFAASAVAMALDLPDFLRHAGPGHSFPISVPLAGEWPVDALRQAVAQHVARGYRFLKVKVGRDLERDIAAARYLLDGPDGRGLGIVFDANQGYSREAALAFARTLRDCNPGRLQWFEQPVDRQDWTGLEQLCRSGVPIVIDESIYDAADVDRAAAVGAYGVKLKLVKNLGMTETLKLARQARDRGLVVVFGNGVATDVGNLCEFLTLAAGDGMFAVPSECSGFAKLKRPLLAPTLEIDGQGRVVCTLGPEALATRLSDFAAAAC
jgi:L-alanine-DL-glutamate epimerase-like enolase superfamily enzyme